MKQPDSASPESPQSDSATPQPPQRSRNAKAQARHRAKRKAYIEQLEQTVSRLQAALSVPPEQLGASHARVQELEQENLRLRAEIDMLKAQLGVSPIDNNGRRTMPFGNSTSDLPKAREGKRRRLSADTPADQNLYLASTASGAQDASAALRNVPLLSLPPLPPATSTYPGANAPSSNNASSLFGYPQASTGTASTTSSPYSMTSSFSTLPDPLPSPRRSLDSFRDSGDPMRLPQTQLHSQQQLPPLGVGYARRTPDPPGYASFQETQGLPTFDLSSDPPDMGAWRGYTSYARGP